MVGILEGLAPLPGRLGVSEVSEQTERASCSSDASEASLPRRLLALLPALLPARLAGPLAPRFGSDRKTKTEGKEFKMLIHHFGQNSNVSITTVLVPRG